MSPSLTPCLELVVSSWTHETPTDQIECWNDKHRWKGNERTWKAWGSLRDEFVWLPKSPSLVPEGCRRGKHCRWQVGPTKALVLPHRWLSICSRHVLPGEVPLRSKKLVRALAHQQEPSTAPVRFQSFPENRNKTPEQHKGIDRRTGWTLTTWGCSGKHKQPNT